MDTMSEPNRRTVLAATAGSFAFASTTASARQATAEDADAIRPFCVDVPEEALVDLRRRINANKVA